MRIIVSIIASGSVLALAACDPAVPDSAAGVGFETSPFDTAPPAGTTINGDPLVPPVRVASTPIAIATTTPTPAPRSPAKSTGAGSLATPSYLTDDDLAREAAAALAATQANSGQAPVQASPSNPAPQTANNDGISDENDFSAVSSRQSIQSDAERLAQQRAQYQVVTPTAVPARTSAAGPNVVGYALSTSHPRGTRVYSRTGINLAAKSARNCAGFASPDQAQQAFLEMGGPKRDRKALDPDGDGYACGWDPAPYRRAVRN